eukprot:snap_masked-scaffold_13-processed-gene-6.14-mRNA-1 protein AED:1.00 eAED:1.00 QI:0/0/0/0/1/1/2/0/333
MNIFPTSRTVSKKIKQQSQTKLVLYEKGYGSLHVRSVLATAKEISITEMISTLDCSKFLSTDISGADLDSLAKLSQEMRLRNLVLNKIELDENTWIRFLEKIFSNALNISSIKFSQLNLFNELTTTEIFLNYIRKMKKLRILSPSMDKGKSKILLDFFKATQDKKRKFILSTDDNFFSLSKGFYITGYCHTLISLSLSLKPQDECLLITGLKELSKTNVRYTLLNFTFIVSPCVNYHNPYIFSTLVFFVKAMVELQSFNFVGLHSVFPQHTSSLILQISKLFQKMKEYSRVRISFQDRKDYIGFWKRYENLGNRFKSLYSSQEGTKTFRFSSL